MKIYIEIGDLVQLTSESDLTTLLSAIQALREDVRTLKTQEGIHHMALSAAVTAIISAMKEATDKIAARIQTLVDRLNTGEPLTAEDKAAFQAEITRLTELGKDPANPVPEDGPADHGE